MPYDRITQAAIDYATNNGPTQLAKLRVAIEAKHPGAIARAQKRLREARIERKFVGNPPAWVKRFVMKYEPALREIRWHRSRVGAFHGECQGGWLSGNEISVTVPADLTGREDDAKMLVLHELAHARAPYGAGHGDDFYDQWAKLLKAEGLYRRAVAHYGGRSGSRRGGSLRAAARRLRDS